MTPWPFSAAPCQCRGSGSRRLVRCTMPLAVYGEDKMLVARPDKRIAAHRGGLDNEVGSSGAAWRILNRGVDGATI